MAQHHPHAELLRAAAEDTAALDDFEIQCIFWPNANRWVHPCEYTGWIYEPEEWLSRRKPHLAPADTKPTPKGLIHRLTSFWRAA